MSRTHVSLWWGGLGNGDSRCGKGTGRRNSEWGKLMMKAWGDAALWNLLKETGIHASGEESH